MYYPLNSKIVQTYLNQVTKWFQRNISLHLLAFDFPKGQLANKNLHWYPNKGLFKSYGQDQHQLNTHPPQ